MSYSGVDLGLDSLREIIEERQPLLCVCGHVHESFGEEKLGRTLCVNVGSLKEGNFAVIDLEEMKVERCNL